MEIRMKSDLRIAVTKRMIKDGMLELLKTKPLSKIKVSELCERSGVNRATFYRHYETLQDTFRELEIDFIKQLPLPHRPPKDIEEAHHNMEIVCTYIYDHADVVRLLFLNKADTEIIHGMKEFYQEFLELYKEKMPVTQMDEDTAQIIIALFGGGCQSLIRKWILDDIHKTPGEIATILCNIIRWPIFSDFFPKDSAGELPQL